MNSEPVESNMGSVGRLSRRGFLALAGIGVAVTAAGSELAAGAADAAPAGYRRPTRSPLVPADQAITLWYPQPADPDAMIQQGLPVGNGRLGALVSGDPAHDLLLLVEASMWTGGRNGTLGGDGQFPYGSTDFGSLTLLGRLTLDLPDHAGATDYRRALDLSNGLVTSTYRVGTARFRRETFVSAPDDVLVVRLTAEGGSFTGSLTLAGTHGETTDEATIQGGFDNGLRYAALVTATADGGTVGVADDAVTFTGCGAVTVVVAGGTNYVPDPARGWLDPDTDPIADARHTAAAAARLPGDALRDTHVADHRALFDRMTVDFGQSTADQKALDTWARLNARAADGAAADPELEASYLQFGRYLTICGSRTGLPMGLQSVWLDRNDPDWMGDYHTDINLQMNYWLADRAGLSGQFDAFADYCVAALPSWTALTRELFNDPRNGFRNSTGRIAGWTIAISTNIYGGNGWWWHPAGSAWLCNSLYDHYQYTVDRQYLAKIFPLLRGACEFWQARLLTATVDGHEVLIDDADWSPEQGPPDAKGITYAQELVWALFGNYVEACRLLGRDADHAATIDALRAKLYLPKVSPTTGWLEEWMTPDNLGDPTHRHLSPLVGLFPGDRIRLDGSPADLVTGARNLLTARGMQSYGWGCAWRALCWARLHDADRAYQLVITNLRPSLSNSNGSAPNLFDMYSFGASRSTFQIDANLGTPAAMLEMLLYSRPGVIELLPALPSAWQSGRVTGIGARGGHRIDLTWTPTQVTATIHAGSTADTTVRHGSRARTLPLHAGHPTTAHFPR
ncbi:glycoside hydrolase family 95 protein [Actinocatenispora comari]|uniref:Alpha-L-fucosidase 2 n=1 Tax=Actinocatenispora comari TaxID=2807577 RepID=A0A8J4A7G9_9ACTN|nr:glycoside hydrolase family 95 protein [Actinocatenispora comari]GIL26236.1 hypothetical protein NUM_14900 [Actinocatenispora comari]